MTGVLTNALWTRGDAGSDRVYIARFDEIDNLPYEPLSPSGLATTTT